MKLTVERTHLTIIPENAQDQAYIEEVLGLKKKGDKISLVRVNTFRLESLAYIRTVFEKEDVHVDKGSA